MEDPDETIKDLCVYAFNLVKHLKSVICDLSKVSSIYLYFEYDKTYKNILNSITSPFLVIKENLSFQSTCACKPAVCATLTYALFILSSL